MARVVLVLRAQPSRRYGDLFQQTTGQPTPLALKEDHKASFTSLWLNADSLWSKYRSRSRKAFGRPKWWWITKQGFFLRRITNVHVAAWLAPLNLCGSTSFNPAHPRYSPLPNDWIETVRTSPKNPSQDLKIVGPPRCQPFPLTTLLSHFLFLPPMDPHSSRLFTLLALARFICNAFPSPLNWAIFSRHSPLTRHAHGNGSSGNFTPEA